MRELLEVYQRGDHLDDAELLALRNRMHELANISGEFGELFRLTYAYAHMVAVNCNSFIKARAENARPAIPSAKEI